MLLQYAEKALFGLLFYWNHYKIRYYKNLKM